MISSEPIEYLLPGQWTLSFTDELEDQSGAGSYTFKLAGVFDADVRDTYSGRAQWHGYWEVEAARLLFTAHQMHARCMSCLGGGSKQHWEIELEQVTDDAFSGLLRREGVTRPVLLQRE